MPVGEAPLVVVPGAELSPACLGHAGQAGVEDGARRMVVEVRGHQRLAGVLEEDLQVGLGSLFQPSLVDLSRWSAFSRRNERSTSETLIVGTRISKAIELALQVRHSTSRRGGGRRSWSGSCCGSPSAPGAGPCGTRRSGPGRWCTSAPCHQPRDHADAVVERLDERARQFVVHDAFEITVSEPCSDLWLTP